MCGRYKLSAKSVSLYEFFDIHGEIPFEFVPRYNIAPTQAIAVVREPHRIELLRWGLKLPNPKADGFNVRVESLAAPFHRDSIYGRRCLIIADGFYEWVRREAHEVPMTTASSAPTSTVPQRALACSFFGRQSKLRS